MRVIRGGKKSDEDGLTIGGLVGKLELAGCRQQGTVNGQLGIELQNKTWYSESGER